MLLCVHIDLKSRFELYRQFLIVDRDLLDQPPDQRFGIFRDRRRLLIHEGGKVIDAFLNFRILRRHCQDVLPFLPEADNGIPDFIDLCLVFSSVQKFVLLLPDCRINRRQPLFRVSVYRCPDVFFQNREEDVPSRPGSLIAVTTAACRSSS